MLTKTVTLAGDALSSFLAAGGKTVNPYTTPPSVPIAVTPVVATNTSPLPAPILTSPPSVKDVVALQTPPSAPNEPLATSATSTTAAAVSTQALANQARSTSTAAVVVLSSAAVSVSSTDAAAATLLSNTRVSTMRALTQAPVASLRAPSSVASFAATPSLASIKAASTEQQNKSPLSAGAVAGIVSAIIFILALVVIFVTLRVKRRQLKQAEEEAFNEKTQAFRKHEKDTKRLDNDSVNGFDFGALVPIASKTSDGQSYPVPVPRGTEFDRVLVQSGKQLTPYVGNAPPGHDQGTGQVTPNSRSVSPSVHLPRKPAPIQQRSNTPQAGRSVSPLAPYPTGAQSRVDMAEPQQSERLIQYQRPTSPLAQNWSVPAAQRAISPVPSLAPPLISNTTIWPQRAGQPSSEMQEIKDVVLMPPIPRNVPFLSEPLPLNIVKRSDSAPKIHVEPPTRPVTMEAAAKRTSAASDGSFSAGDDSFGSDGSESNVSAIEAGTLGTARTEVPERSPSLLIAADKWAERKKNLKTNLEINAVIAQSPDQDQSPFADPKEASASEHYMLQPMEFETKQPTPTEAFFAEVVKGDPKQKSM